MNERIRLLAKQANDYAESKLDDGYAYDEIHFFYEQKFAELIVRECAMICDHQSRSGWNDDRKAQARLDRDLIKEHFGVEE